MFPCLFECGGLLILTDQGWDEQEEQRERQRAEREERRIRQR